MKTWASSSAPNAELPGVYSVSTAHQGFKLNVQSGNSLQVGQTARADFHLEIGDTAERVFVTAEASVLDTETSDCGSVIGGRTIVELPLNGRDFMHSLQRWRELQLAAAVSTGVRRFDRTVLERSGARQIDNVPQTKLY
jgi:hypothetical protein